MLTAYRQQYLLALAVLFIVTALIITFVLFSYVGHINVLHILSLGPNVIGWIG